MKTKTKNISLTAVYLSKELKKRIKVYCALNDSQIQVFYREALEEKLKKGNKK